MQVFLSSPWVPAEWIRAHGLTPRGVWSLENLDRENVGLESVPTTTHGGRFSLSSSDGERAGVRGDGEKSSHRNSPLGAGVCAFANALERWAAAHPEAAFIFSTHCDQLRRGFDAVPESASLCPAGTSENSPALPVLGSVPFLPSQSPEGRQNASAGSQGAPVSPPASLLVSCRAGARTFLFNLPATWQSPAARQLFSAELERLGRFLIGLGGHAPAIDELNRLVEESNAARAQLRDAATWCPARAYAAAVARFHWNGSVCLPPPPARVNSKAVPLALLGGPLPPSQWNLLDTLEQAGGRVVLNATEGGERSLGLCSALTDGEVTPQALAQACLEACIDVFQRPNTRLYDWLQTRLTARQVRGIILWHYVGCDLWRAEAQSLREAFGLPLLALDADETASATPRTATRIEAFLESLRG